MPKTLKISKIKHNDYQVGFVIFIIKLHYTNYTSMNLESCT